VEKQGYEQDDEGEAAEIGQHAEARPDFTVEDQRPSPEIIDICTAVGSGIHRVLPATSSR